MTNAEKKQPHSVFVSAGRKAYLMLIHIQNNPYTIKPYRDLWEKGYRSAKRKSESGRFAGTAQEPTTEQPKRFEKKFNRDRRPPQASGLFVQMVGRGTRTPPPVRTERPVMTAKRVDQFNNKYRTVV